MKIFLLEDDYSLNETIKESLELNNHEVETFYDGEVAFNNVTFEYDLYILDINTPSLSGIEILKIIKKINENAKVIMISANINIQTIKESYLNGCDDYIKKPFDIEELILKIEKIYVKKENIYLDENIYFDTISKNFILKNNINEKIELTKIEKNLLILLLENRGKIISCERIEDFVYKGEAKSSSSIRSLVKRLRKKLPKDIIQNSVDEGYFIK